MMNLGSAIAILHTDLIKLFDSVDLPQRDPFREEMLDLAAALCWSAKKDAKGMMSGLSCTVSEDSYHKICRETTIEFLKFCLPRRLQLITKLSTWHSICRKDIESKIIPALAVIIVEGNKNFDSIMERSERVK